MWLPQVLLNGQHLMAQHGDLLLMHNICPWLNTCTCVHDNAGILHTHAPKAQAKGTQVTCT